MKMRFIRKKYIKTLILSTSLLIGNNVLAEKIRDIQVTGNQRIEQDTVVNYLALHKGDEFSAGMQGESIKKLYATQLFDDISIKFSNGVLIVDVKETPLVTKIHFNGNSRIKTTTLQKDLLCHQGSSLSKADIKFDVEKIKEIYRKSGRYAVMVNARVEELENNRAKIIFDIIEGPKTSVKYINFVGNINYKDSELRSIVFTKESAWFRFMDTSDTYDPERVEYDKYLLKRFYTSLGYADFNVVSAIAELSPTKEHFTLTYTIDEGEKYNFGEINIESNIEEINAAEFQKFLTAKTGEIYSSASIEKISDQINEKLSNEGYTGALVYPEEVIDRDNKVVNIKFVIQKGSKTYINKIKIEGNLKTRDNAIRRQLKVSEGDLFNRSAVNKSEQNIRNLDYFETVSVETEMSETAKNKADISIKVEEKSTSSIQFEVGYNSMEGPVGRVNFVERNLIGTGKYLTAGVDKYRKKISYHAGVIDPYFMDRDLLAGITFFNMDSKGSDELPYNLQAVGANLRMGYEFATDLRHDITYTIKRDRLSGGDKDAPSMFIREQYGKKVTSAISNSLTYDKTDSVVVPKNGYIVSFTETDSGLGGHTKYLKHEAEFKAFKSFSNNDYTIKLTGEVGAINGYGGKKVGISDRFNLGDFSMRGFEASGLGPRDKRTKESLGGQKYYTISTELLFPVGLPKEFNVQGAVFSDFGALWDFDVLNPNNYSKKDVYNSTAPRMSVGAGIVWVTRFAPIRLDYAIPIKKEPYDKTQHWHFRFSTSF